MAAPRESTIMYHNIKDNERNLCQDLLTIENTDSDLKVHALHYANELLVRVRLIFLEEVGHAPNCIMG